MLARIIMARNPYPEFLNFPIWKHPLPLAAMYQNLTDLCECTYYELGFVALWDNSCLEWVSWGGAGGVSTVLNVPSKYAINQWNAITQPLFRALLPWAKQKLFCAFSSSTNVIFLYSNQSLRFNTGASSSHSHSFHVIEILHICSPRK